jgi:hypothetical protein
MSHNPGAPGPVRRPRWLSGEVDDDPGEPDSPPPLRARIEARRDPPLVSLWGYAVELVPSRFDAGELPGRLLPGHLESTTTEPNHLDRPTKPRKDPS